MSLHTIEDLTSCILDFQANIVRITNRKKTTLVDPEIEDAHAAALMAIWECSKLEEEIDANGHPLRWRKLGFDTEDIIQEFSEVGVLGLECLVSTSYQTRIVGILITLLCFIEKICGKRSRIFQGKHNPTLLSNWASSASIGYSRATKSG